MAGMRASTGPVQEAGTDLELQNVGLLDADFSRDRGLLRQQEPRGSFPLWRLFMGADRTDVLCMVAGGLAAVARGCVLPMAAVLLGQGFDLLAAQREGRQLADNSGFPVQVQSMFVFVILLACGAGLVSYLQLALWTAAGARQAVQLQRRYLAALLDQEVGYFDGKGPAQLIADRIAADAELLQEAIGPKAAQALELFTVFSTGLLVAFAVQWRLAVVMLPALPLLVVAGTLTWEGEKPPSVVGHKGYEDAHRLAEQALTHIRTTQTCTAGQQVVRQYGSLQRTAYSTALRSGLGIAFGRAFAPSMGLLCCGLAFWYGSFLVADRTASGGEVVTVLFAMLLAGRALGHWFPLVSSLSTGKEAGGRFMEVINRTPLKDPPSAGTTLSIVAGNIEFRNVSFSYPSRPEIPILQGFFLFIWSGEKVALVGERGSGRSTVLALIERFYDPQVGSIFMDTVDLRRLRVRWLRSHIAIVTQEPALFSASIRENIAIGRDGASDEEILAAAVTANLHGFVQRLPDGYETAVGASGFQLSVGQKQRVAIARAVLRDPKILLLDEATSALDADSEQKVWTALEQLMIKRTVVMVAHKVGETMGAGNIAVIQGGRVVEEGSHSELVNKEGGAYAALVRLQNLGTTEDHTASHTATTVPRVSTPDSPKDSDSLLHEDRCSLMAVATGGFVSSLDEDTAVANMLLAAEAEASRIGGKRSRAPTGWWWWGRGQEEGDMGQPPPVAQVSAFRLLRLSLRDVLLVVLVAVAAAMAGLVAPAVGLVVAEMVFQLYGQAVRREAELWALGMVALAPVVLLVVLLQKALVAWWGERLVRRVRGQALAAAVGHEVEWFNRGPHSAAVVARLLRDGAPEVKPLVAGQVAARVRSTVGVTAGLVLIVLLNWRLAAVAVAAAPVLMLMLWCQGSIRKGYVMEGRAQRHMARQVAADAVRHIHTVAAYAAEDAMRALFDEQVVAVEHQALWAGQVSGIAAGLVHLVSLSSFNVFFWYSSRLVDSGQAALRAVLQVALVTLFTAMDFHFSQLLLANLAHSRAPIASLLAIVDRRPDIDANAPALVPPTFKGQLAFRWVDFAYPSRPHVHILRGFSLEVLAGKTVAIVGERGSGKSTAVALLLRLYDPTLGVVLLDGADIKGLQLNWVRRHIGLVSQDPALLSGTIRDNIVFGCDGGGGSPSQDEIEAAAKVANIHAFIRRLPEGYATAVGDQGLQLSLGQKQRVAIARAVLRHPRVLILDEGTSGLDLDSERRVRSALDELMRGRTMLVVAHRLSAAAGASKVAVIQGGAVVEEGTHEELMARPDGAYTSFLRLQDTSSSVLQGGGQHEDEAVVVQSRASRLETELSRYQSLVKRRGWSQRSRNWDDGGGSSGPSYRRLRYSGQ